MNELPATASIADRIIYKELKAQRRLLEQLLNRDAENSIEEMSLNKTRKFLKLSEEGVINLVKTGKLRARTYKDAKKITRYRFRVADVRAFQKAGKYDHVSLHAGEVESTESIIERTFGKKDRMRSRANGSSQGS